MAKTNQLFAEKCFMGFILIMFTGQFIALMVLRVRDEYVFEVFFDFQESVTGVAVDKEYNNIKDDHKFLRLATD